MEAFRLVREKYAGHLSGKGAALRGARWNPIGIELIYTAENRSLAMAEVAVHFTLETLPADYMMMTLELPDDISFQVIGEVELPADWKEFPHPTSTQTFGEKFVKEGRACVLKVPSVVTKGDFNLLINPAHPDFERITIKSIVDFPFDRRIFK